MPRTRHHDIVGTIGPDGFTPARPKAKPRRAGGLNDAAFSRAIRAGVREGFARTATAAPKATKDAAAASAARLADSLDGITEAARACADSRRLRAARV